MQRRMNEETDRWVEKKKGGCVLVYYRMKFRRRGRFNIDSKVGIRLFAVPEQLRRLWGFPRQIQIILLSGEGCTRFPEEAK